jgi:4,4'-diaponeurosporenoate glycosyltransferase
MSVIVPARDEERSLPRLLRSLAGQTMPPLEVIVVDDHSRDDTAARAAAAGARVLSSAPLPDGWTGKTWACHQGAAVKLGARRSVSSTPT